MLSFEQENEHFQTENLCYRQLRQELCCTLKPAIFCPFLEWGRFWGPRSDPLPLTFCSYIRCKGIWISHLVECYVGRPVTISAVAALIIIWGPSAKEDSFSSPFLLSPIFKGHEFSYLMLIFFSICHNSCKMFMTFYISLIRRPCHIQVLMHIWYGEEKDLMKILLPLARPRSGSDETAASSRWSWLRRKGLKTWSTWFSFSLIAWGRKMIDLTKCLDPALADQWDDHIRVTQKRVVQKASFIETRKNPDSSL